MQNDTPLTVIPGYPGYHATRDGSIWSTKQGAPRRMSARPDRHGYLTVSLKERGKSQLAAVHKLVLLAYAGPKPTPKHVCRHLNGDQLDNHAENLAWGTVAENIADVMAHGRGVQFGRRGEDGNTAKLTEEQVREIEARARTRGETLKSLAREYGVSWKHIANIRDHKNWRHLWPDAA